MNHHHRKVLQALFDHPVSGNIRFREVETVLQELGAELDARSGDRIGVRLSGHSAVFHRAQHDLPKEEVLRIKDFLVNCGVRPEDYPL
jgi:hypothetical protein